MKQFYFFTFLLFTSSLSFGQIIFGENFESGGANWTLNSGDEGGIGVDAPSNQWMITNVYSSIWGVITPDQPIEITNFPQSNYLHIGNGALSSTNAIYLDAASQPFFGGIPGLNFVKMNGDISTAGYTGVHLSFYWLDQGNLGKTYYSIDGGVSWVSIGGDFNGQSNWGLFDIADAAFDNQPTLRLGFSFDNTIGAPVLDPPFAIDEIFIYVPSDNEEPIASFTMSDTEICAGESITFTDASTVSGATTYDWSFSNGAPATANTQGPHVITFNTIGTFDITLTVTDVNGTDDVTMSVTVNASTDATISFAGPFCLDDSSLLLSAVDGGGAWSGTGIVNASTGVFDPATAGIGSHVITYEIAGNCGDSNSITIVVEGSDATITQVGPFCPNDAIQFLIAENGGGVWSGTGITNSVTGAFDPSVANDGDNLITYTIAGDCGDEDSITIVISSSSDATITQVGPFCSDVTLQTLSAVDAGGTWSGTGITNAATGEFDPSQAIIGDNIITYEIAGSCGDTDEITIVIEAATDATITQAGPFCPDDVNVFLVTEDPGGIWSGTGIVNTSTGEFSPAAANDGANEITYTIAGTCGDSDMITISVTSSPDASVEEVSETLCENDDAITLISVTAGGAWSGVGVNAVTGEFDPAIAGEGTHTITYTITSSCGDADDTIDVTVIAGADASITSVEPLCSDADPISLVSVDTGGVWSGSGVNATTGEFDPVTAGVGSHEITYTILGECGDSQSIFIDVTGMADATILSTSDICISDDASNLSAVTVGGVWSGVGITNASNGEFNPAVAGIGAHDITYTLAGDCGDMQTISIEVTDLVSASIIPSGPYCSNENSTILLGVNSGGTWSGTGITNVNTGEFFPNIAGTGTHIISYTTLGNCGETQEVSIVVNAVASIDIIPPNTLCIDDQAIQLSASPSGGVWTGVGIVDDIVGMYNPANAGVGTHVVVYTLDDLCGSSSSQEIIVDLCEETNVYLPNAFSPNADGNNDVLYVRGKGIETVNLVVYDRWGEQVFKTTDQSIGWDGTFNGKELNPGTYYYSLSVDMVDKSIINQSGSILLAK